MTVSDPLRSGTPWVPEGRTAVLEGRGEVFYRRYAHPDPDAPTLLLLHGWTADADSQFFSAYQTLAERYSFIAIDHRGHGRGMRSNERVTLEALADDAAALVELLGVGPVITIGYSMGGPVSMLLARRHPGLAVGMVLQATALEWQSTRIDRARWWLLVVLGVLLRSSLYPRVARRYLGRMVGASNREPRLLAERRAAPQRPRRRDPARQGAQPVRRTVLGVLARAARRHARHHGRPPDPTRQAARPSRPPRRPRSTSSPPTIWRRSPTGPSMRPSPAARSIGSQPPSTPPLAPASSPARRRRRWRGARRSTPGAAGGRPSDP